MIKIGDFAKICNVSTQTLRYYDAEGILRADATDSSSGYRFYSVDAVEKYKQILFYKKLGFSLDEIKKLQSATNEQLKDMLQNKKAELSKSIDQFKTQIKTIEDMCNDDKLKKPHISEALLLPFENDPQMVGKWHLCGKLIDEKELTVIKEISPKMADQEIIFMPGGAFAWKYFWTKGTLYRISSKYNFAIPNLYRVIERDGIKYMILQFMMDDCIDNGKDTITLLYRQVDCIAYTEHQIRPYIDKTDLPFVNDEYIYGTWTVCDYVPKISDFNPKLQYSSDENIYMVDIRFLPRGICTRRIRSVSGVANYIVRYTKGFVINDREMTAEEYQIKNFDGTDFLFVQHKSGDYFYGGKTPRWYVFKRREK